MSKKTYKISRILKRDVNQNPLRLLLSDPLLFSRKLTRFLKLQLEKPRKRFFYHTVFDEYRLKRFVPWTHGKKTKVIHGVEFEFDLDLSPHVCAWYLGIEENSTVELMRQSLKKGDTFIDVGANIGFISAHAAAYVGQEGQVHSFEPVPKYYELLSQFARKNNKYTIVANNMALGDHDASTSIDVTDGLGMSTLVKGLRKWEHIEETIEIRQMRLDDYIFENKLTNISFIKIDVEGYELNVLKGLSRYLETESAQDTRIYVEIMPYAYQFQGYSLKDLDDFLRSVSFVSVNCDLLNLKTDDPNFVINALLVHSEKENVLHDGHSDCVQPFA